MLLQLSKPNRLVPSCCSLVLKSLHLRTFALGQHTNEEEANGLSFKLSDQQLAVQELARKFAKEEMIPMEKHHDQSMEYPHEIFAKVWELGLLNTHIPEVRWSSCTIICV